MSILVTGAAGFIGYHVAEALIARGDEVIGIDNLSDYYDVGLKNARLERLKTHSAFTFKQLDIADDGAMVTLSRSLSGATGVVHLAAQAGVRYSMVNPQAYLHSNVTGHLNILETCRHIEGLKHLVYASSSSVYGGNTSMPFSEDDSVDHPVSLYAATKKTDELMSHTYSHLYGIPATGLRFFTVYGPWGRPDMAYYSFAEAIFRGETIHVFNHGEMKRDFTYIDDIVSGVLTVLDHPLEVPSRTLHNIDGGAVPHRIYNIGNNRAENLLRFIKVIENAVGKTAKLKMVAMQPGEVKETYADITLINRDFGFSPTTSIDEGIPLFIEWYREYHGR
ncbi:MAG: NAD-dependent epimerase/dehydratase family protein [Alphaproteobacteria bacterium]|nr:NAD-dependent epimerase/dehydratase family protein [Alphaproteobacteria bacterium]